VKVWEDYWYRWLPSETLHGGIGSGAIFRRAEHCPSTSSDIKVHLMHRRLKRKLRSLQHKVVVSTDSKVEENEVVESNGQIIIESEHSGDAQGDFEEIKV